MASFTNKTFKKHDDYMTPKSAWEDIKDFIPKDKVIWEAFYGSGDSGKYLKEMGFNTIHEEIDFFENNLGEIIVSNPPFTIIPQILERLVEMGKPFILIMPVSKMNTQYFRKTFLKKNEIKENPIQIIVPKKRIQFMKTVDGKVPEGYKSSANFDCYYYCWKMQLENDINWLE